MRMVIAWGLLALLSVLAGCAGQPGHPETQASGDEPTGHGAVFLPLERYPTFGVELFPAYPPGTRKGLAGVVEALTTYTPGAPFTNPWEGMCAPGRDFADVVVTDDLVTVRFDRDGGSMCERPRREVAVLGQQMAWTVAHAIGSRTPVVVTVGKDHHRVLGPLRAKQRYRAPSM